MLQRSFLPRRMRKVLAPLFIKQAVASCVLVLFCFQFSRYYFIIELDRFLCLEANHVHLAGSVSAHDHHHEGDEALPHSHDDEGYAFQHCKDTFNGIALTPVQPLALTAPTPVRKPQTAWATLRTENPQVSDIFLSPPFEPPRS